MAKSRTFGYYVVKTVRVSGWALLVLMLVYISTGYAMKKEYGFDRLITQQIAEALHFELDELMVLVFLAHAAGAIYLALRRWGWIGKRRKI